MSASDATCDRCGKQRRPHASRPGQFYACACHDEARLERQAAARDRLASLPRRDTATPSTPEVADRGVPGGSFALDLPESVDPLWGAGDEVLWAPGEALLLVGPIGTGKTSIAQQVVLHGIGVRPGPLLGYDVNLPDGLVGYVAGDRPEQARRSVRRMVSEADRALLDGRMEVWRGPLPFDLAGAPPRRSGGPGTPDGALADFCEARGWRTLVIDSLKDVAGGTTDDESGLRINRQLQEVLVRGIEVLVLHHQRKASDSNRRPRKLDDVFGSRWITAGVGSVLMLWGEAGDEGVEMTHLKPPVDRVGPLPLRHDHPTGTTVVDGTVQVNRVPRDTRARVIAALPGTVDEIATAVGASPTTVKGHLYAMRREGKATSDQPVQAGPAVWSASDDGAGGPGALGGRHPALLGRAGVSTTVRSTPPLDDVQQVSTGLSTEGVHRADVLTLPRVRRVKRGAARGGVG